MNNNKIVFVMREYEIVKTCGIYASKYNRHFEIYYTVYTFDQAIDLNDQNKYYGICRMTTDEVIKYENMTPRDTMKYQNFLNTPVNKYFIKARYTGKVLYLQKGCIDATLALNVLCFKQIASDPEKYDFSCNISNQMIEINEIENSYKIRDLICDNNGNIILKPNQYFIIGVKM